MIIWLSSFPKSGNTFLRTLLTAYFYTKKGDFQQTLLENIENFPSIELFSKFGISTLNDNEFPKYYIEVQKKLNSLNKNKIFFLKTHSNLMDINGCQFTDLDNTLGAIYIVRDPRTLIKSYANHYEFNLEEATDRISQFVTLSNQVSTKKIEKPKIVTHVGSWAQNYHSWKVLKNFNKYLLIKYEDLVNNTEETFIKVLEFINNLQRSNLSIDTKKLNNTIKTTSFDKLKKMEAKEGFKEALTNTDGKKITFFKYGPKNNNLNTIPLNLKKKIESIFKNELEELDYI